MEEKKVTVRWVGCSSFEIFHYDVLLRVWHLDYVTFSKKIKEILGKILERHKLRIKNEELEKNLSPERLKEALNPEAGIMMTILLPATYGYGKNIGEAEVTVKIGAYKSLLFLNEIEGLIRKPCRV